MSGHEMCTEGVFFIPSDKPKFEPEKYLGKSLIDEPSKLSEDQKDKVIADLTAALQHYAGTRGELAIVIETDLDLTRLSPKAFSIVDKNGIAFIARSEVVALQVLREYNLIKQE